MIYIPTPKSSALLPNPSISDFQIKLSADIKKYFEAITKFKDGDEGAISEFSETLQATIRRSFLYPFQLIAQLYFCDEFPSVDRSDMKGIQLYYNMGTGKTFTALCSAYEYTVKYPQYN
jgi:hypothetical protein